MDIEYDHTLTNKINFSLDKLYQKDPEILSSILNGYKDNKASIKEKDKKYTIGYQGVPGAFSEEALTKYFKEYTYETIPCATFEGVLKNLKDKKIDYGVLPIENSSAGSVVEVYDLIRKYSCYIVGEETLSVKHNLLGLPGTKLEDITKVYSHPQGFSQSRAFLDDYMDWRLIPYHNTAISAQHVKECNQKNKAAIASIRAAKLYGLEVIKENINFSVNNYTRFIIVTRDMCFDDQSNKVSMIFSTAHQSGSLYHALAHFYYNGLSLLKIESRPIHDRSWEYFFFVDLEGNLKDANLLIALGRILDQSAYFQLLGNYRAG
ncbi:MAG TPA: bifunctional chorismate mutase/prephenate dehydratase [Epulopiscium sp.]|nr:bifunctional chorismate mutase/prephenate dehydratase [Candidatus Epulonipiscium sp.]